MKRILIFGDLGFAKEVIGVNEFGSLFESFEVLEFISENNEMDDYTAMILKRKIFNALNKSDVDGGILAIRNNFHRKFIYESIQSVKKDFNFISIIHPSVVIGKNVSIGKGCILMPGVVINSASKIGVSCIIDSQSSVGHEGILQNFSSISCGVITGGNLVLGSLSKVSLGVNIIENITIGKNCIIGSGSLILNNISNNIIASGIPAKIVETREENDLDQYLDLIKIVS